MGNQDYNAWYWWKVDNDGHDDHLVFMIIWLRYNFNTSTSNIYNDTEMIMYKFFYVYKIQATSYIDCDKMRYKHCQIVY